MPTSLEAASNTCHRPEATTSREAIPAQLEKSRLKSLEQNSQNCYWPATVSIQAAVRGSLVSHAPRIKTMCTNAANAAAISMHTPTVLRCRKRRKRSRLQRTRTHLGPSSGVKVEEGAKATDTELTALLFARTREPAGSCRGFARDGARRLLEIIHLVIIMLRMLLLFYPHLRRDTRWPLRQISRIASGRGTR